MPLPICAVKFAHIQLRAAFSRSICKDETEATFERTCHGCSSSQRCNDRSHHTAGNSSPRVGGGSAVTCSPWRAGCRLDVVPMEHRPFRKPGPQRCCTRFLRGRRTAHVRPAWNDRCGAVHHRSCIDEPPSNRTRLHAVRTLDVVIGTTCGFAGHSISSWGSLTGSAAAIGMASIAILSRRAAQ